VLELDVVQEQVAWFSERGSKTLQLPLVLEPGGRESIAGHAPPPEGADFEPWMQMFAVSRDEVSAVVEAHQGRVLDVLAGEQAGPAYEDHLYVVGRSSDWSARPVIARLSAAVAEIPDRPDMLPPVFSNRRGVRRRLELAIRRTAARLTRWFTRTQVDHDRAVARSLAEMQTALAVHDAELRALRSELARSSSRAEAPDA
jgi:hypothetical protein